MNSIDFHSYKNAFRLGFLFFYRMENTSSSFYCRSVFFFLGILEQRFMDCMFGRSLDTILFLNSFKMNMGCDKSCLLTTPFLLISCIVYMYVCVCVFFSSFCCCPLLSISFDINGVCLSFYFSLLFANNGIENWRKTG